MEAEDFGDIQQFLADAGMDETSISRLVDAGFDDFESLQLAELNTIKILGFENPEKVFAIIQQALGVASEYQESQMEQSRHEDSKLEKGVLL